MKFLTNLKESICQFIRPMTRGDLKDPIALEIVNTLENNPPKEWNLVDEDWNLSDIDGVHISLLNRRVYRNNKSPFEIIRINDIIVCPLTEKIKNGKERRFINRFISQYWIENRKVLKAYSVT